MQGVHCLSSAEDQAIITNVAEKRAYLGRREFTLLGGGKGEKSNLKKIIKSKPTSKAGLLIKFGGD